MNIRILLVDDFPLIREGFAMALESDPAFRVVGQAEDGEIALRLAQELAPDVVLLDLRMPGMGGITLLERLRVEAPDVKALVVTATEKVNRCSTQSPPAPRDI
jgi:DNA-binding NarL/FixJ family response regulator